MKKYRIYLVIALFMLAGIISVCFIPISVSKLIPAIEEQISAETGTNVHIEKLILRVGPYLKLKSPVMLVMYNDGQKFARFDNVKFYISWGSILRKKPCAKKICANKVMLNINSNDKYWTDFVKKIQDKNFNENPDMHFKEYELVYNNHDNGDKYSFIGHNLDITKVLGYQNWKINTIGSFFINDNKYISYDILFLPNIVAEKCSNLKEIINVINQIQELDLHADVIADIKIYKNKNDNILASGFVNVDNISVLDKINHSPKSFMYLTFLGDKASILSNIYTTKTKKIFIEGVINHSHKSALDLKVKADDISLSDLYKKLKIFTSFSRYKGIDSLTGTLSANFNLKGSLNKIKSNGFLKIKNAKISAGKIQINKINADIDFSDNKINIVNAGGYVENAPIIAKGTIDKQIDVELLMNKVDLKHLIPANIGITQGQGSLVAHLSGTADKLIHKEILLLERLELKKNDVLLTINSLKMDTNKDNIAYANNIVIQNNHTGIIKIPSAKLTIESEYIKLPDTKIFLPNSTLVIKSEILNYLDSNFTFNTEINGDIYPKDLKLSGYLSNKMPVKIQVYGNKESQTFAGQMLFENAALIGEPFVLNLLSKTEKNILKIDDLSISKTNNNNITDFKSNAKSNKKVLINGEIELLNKPAFKNLRIFIPQSLSVNIFDTFIQGKGDIFLNGEIKKPNIIGQITVQHLLHQPLRLDVQNAILDFNKDTSTISAPVCKIADSSFSINSLVSMDFSKKVILKNLNIKSKYINTDTILMYKDVFRDNTIPVVVQEGKFYAEKLKAALYNSPMTLSVVTADFKILDDVVLVRNLTSELYNGKMSGALDFNLKLENYIAKIMARGTSAAPIFNLVSNKKDTLNGTLDFDTDLKGNLLSKSSLNGNVKFIVHNGRMESFGKLEHLLYAQNVLADSMLRTTLSAVTKAISLKDTGLFKYFRGDMTFNNGIANVKMLQTQGPLMTLFAKGQYNPENDYAKFIVLGRLSDEVVSGLGAFGEFSFNKLMVMLTGEEKNNNILFEDMEKLPQLPTKNTKEFRAIINGPLDKNSSVIMFNWISYSKKSLRQNDVPMTNIKVPAFLEDLPY